MLPSMPARITVESPQSRDLETAITVLERGWATAAEVREALQWRSERTPRIGKLAMTCGKLTVSQVFKILDRQAILGGLFGQVAVEMGFLAPCDVDELVALQQRVAPGLADALVTTGKISLRQAQQLADDRTTEPSADESNASAPRTRCGDDAAWSRFQLN